MQKSLSELTSLPPSELSEFMDQLNEPLLVTNDGEPQFVAQSLAGFEAMVRRLRALESGRGRTALGEVCDQKSSRGRSHNQGKVIPLRP
jgi:PHD/YefM family antitoxin component YafN of YafNO toxin-antitoxin module